MVDADLLSFSNQVSANWLLVLQRLAARKCRHDHRDGISFNPRNNSYGFYLLSPCRRLPRRHPAKKSVPCTTRVGFRGRHGLICRSSAWIKRDLQRQPCRGRNVLLSEPCRSENCQDNRKKNEQDEE